MRARFGWLTGVFLVGYGIARITGECFREPDAFLGFLPFGTTMGQIALHADAARRRLADLARPLRSPVPVAIPEPHPAP